MGLMLCLAIMLQLHYMNPTWNQSYFAAVNARGW